MRGGVWGGAAPPAWRRGVRGRSPRKIFEDYKQLLFFLPPLFSPFPPSLLLPFPLLFLSPRGPLPRAARRWSALRAAAFQKANTASGSSRLASASCQHKTPRPRTCCPRGGGWRVSSQYSKTVNLASLAGSSLPSSAATKLQPAHTLVQVVYINIDAACLRAACTLSCTDMRGRECLRGWRWKRAAGEPPPGPHPHPTRTGV